MIYSLFLLKSCSHALSQNHLVDYYPIAVLAMIAVALLILTSFIKIHPLNKDFGLAIYSEPNIIDQFSNTVDETLIPMKGTQSKLGMWVAIILVILLLLMPLYGFLYMDFNIGFNTGFNIKLSNFLY